jgi:hypothetical protein
MNNKEKGSFLPFSLFVTILNLMKFFYLLIYLSLSLIITSCGEAAGDGEGSDGVSVSSHRIFVSSSTHTGNLGGTSGADSICKNLASQAGLVRTYSAIISDNTNSAKNERLVFSGAIYTVDASGQQNLVANSGSALWNTDSTDLLNEINLDENGNIVNDNVWSGTDSDGGSLNTNCSSWTSSLVSESGFSGQSSSATSEWIEAIPKNCNETLRIYCVSQ